MKSYIAHVSSRRLFRALYIESNLARPVIIQIPTQSPGRYTAELPLRRIKLFSFQANSPYVPSTHTLWIFWGLAGWKLRLRPLRFFYVQLHDSQTSLNFSDRANHDERTPYSVYSVQITMYCILYDHATMSSISKNIFLPSKPSIYVHFSKSYIGLDFF